MDIDMYYDLAVRDFEEDPQIMVRKEKEYKTRTDPMNTLSDFEFKRQFRFSKDSVQRLTQLLTGSLEKANNRGLPVKPEDQILITLSHLGGAHFQRTSGWSYGVCQRTAASCVERVVNSLLEIKGEFVMMPNAEEMSKTSERMYERFKLPGFALAVDGMHVRFVEAPRGIPDHIPKQTFWCRKQYFSINVQLVCDDRLIRDVDCSWPGSTHDSRIWRLSEAKRYLEQQRRFKVAGDTGYPISEILIKPYSTQEVGDDRRKRLFNKRLSGARTVMSECIFGVLKRRWPILTAMRNHFVLAQKITVATAILFNIGRLWGDLWEEEDILDDVQEEGVLVQDGDEASMRRRGQIERDRLMDAMPFP